MNDTAHDDARVSELLRSSALLGHADRAIATLWESATRSRTLAVIKKALAPWPEGAVAERRKAIALLLGSAAAAAVATTWFYQPPAGWLWLLPPVMAVSVGLMVLRSAR